jgi:branched-chain amino acid transport system substrate-binding protein
MAACGGLGRRALMAGTASGMVAGRLRPARAQARPLRIGVLTDLSGPYRDTGGPTSVAAARQAAEDFGPGHGLAVEVVAADHQQKPDVAVAIVREWFDRGGVDAVADVNNSAIAFAVTELAQAMDKVQLNTGAFSADIAGVRCSPNLVHWGSDSWQIAKTMATAQADPKNGKWFILAADYAFGAAMQRDLASFVASTGGTLAGSVKYPFPGTADFSSYLLQAQASGANVIAFANAAADFVNSVKQSQEFGLPAQGITPVGLVVFITDIHALGLPVAQGLRLTEGFYWDLNDRTRAFAKRLSAKSPANIPNAEHACTYAAVLHYLKAAASLDNPATRASGRAVVEAMKRMPTDDDCFGSGQVRADGQHMHPAFLFEVKRPAESTGPWDLYKLVRTLPPEQVWRPLAEGGCKMVRAG